jgi:lipopolysaccharide export system permease protein
MPLLDRYIVRQVLMPFLLGLFVFTFIFIVQPLLDYAEQLVAEGASLRLVAGLITLLIPQALAICPSCSGS